MICSSLDDLFAHVERSQVTQDLDGTIMYSHHDWIQQRIVSNFWFLVSLIINYCGAEVLFCQIQNIQVYVSFISIGIGMCKAFFLCARALYTFRTMFKSYFL